MDLSADRKREMYRMLLLSRRLDERAWVLHRQKHIVFHVSAIGHEAAQVAAGFALKKGIDWVAPYPRDLALLLALGMAPASYLKMLLGKPSELDPGGRRLPGEWSLPSANVISISGAAASHAPHAVGIAHAIQLKGESAAVLVSCGEGATSAGEWYEAVNWAAVHRLPVVFLVQNNGLALSTRLKAQMVRSPAFKSSAIGLPVEKVDGTNLFEVYQSLSRMLQEARAGKGPGLVEALVVRIPPHSSDDDDRAYRTRAEVEEARSQDPLTALRRQLLQQGVLTRETAEALDAQVRAEVEEAVQAAEEAVEPNPALETAMVYSGRQAPGLSETLPPHPQPDPAMGMNEVSGATEEPAVLETFVGGEQPAMDAEPAAVDESSAAEEPGVVEAKPAVAEEPGMVEEEPAADEEPAGEETPSIPPAVLPQVTLREALHRALDRAMEADDAVLLLGMDIGVKGGVFRVTEGLLKKFGPARVIDTPLSPAALVGVAVGLAVYGLRPVCEVQFADFLAPAFHQIANEAARMHYRSGGQWGAPLVIRAPYGGGSGGLYHSQSIEAFYAHVPGLKVMAPSDPTSAASLLQAAIADPNPVLFLEPKTAYRLAGPWAEEAAWSPPVAVRLTRPGTDVSIISYGRMHTLVMEAAVLLANEGISVEALDLQVLHPLEMDILLESVRRTGRALVVHEDQRSGGYGAEVAARIAEGAFSSLRAPVARLCGPDTPGVPFHPRLQEWYMLSPVKIARAVRALLA